MTGILAFFDSSPQEGCILIAYVAISTWRIAAVTRQFEIRQEFTRIKQTTDFTRQKRWRQKRCQEPIRNLMWTALAVEIVPADEVK
jgi:hypothetical protein